MSEANDIRRKYAERIIEDVRKFDKTDLQESLKSFIVLAIIDAEWEINNWRLENE